MGGFDTGFAIRAAASKRRRFFTIAQANSALVLVRRIVSDILCEYARLGDLHEREAAKTDALHLEPQAEARQTSGRCGRPRTVRDELIQTVERIRALAGELEDLGAVLKDWTLGIVDFPCIADGTRVGRTGNTLLAGIPVALCWQADEPEVMFWHEIDCQCSSRKPIDVLPAAEIAAVQEF